MSDNVSSAGGSAFREYERRHAKDQAAVEADRLRLKNRFGGGRIGGLVAAVAVDGSERSSTQSWRQGAIGEAKVGAMLDEIACSDILVLHDRRLPGSRANIDHLVITASRVWVIDTKRYIGKRPERHVEGGFFGIGGREGLKVGGRKRDSLVYGVVRQVAHVERAVCPRVSVQGVLCFVDADWPLFGGDFSVGGVGVLWPKLLRKEIVRGVAPGANALEIGRAIEAIFRPA